MRIPNIRYMRIDLALALVLNLATSFPAEADALNGSPVDPRPLLRAANPSRLQPSSLLAIDQNRPTVVDRIVREWGDALRSVAGIGNDQLRDMLTGLRADHLLAATLAGTLDGLRNVLANSLTNSAPLDASLLYAKALGDTADDLTYTPLTPCRLVDTRGNSAPIQGGPFLPGERRTITPGGACSVPTSNVAALMLAFHTQNLTTNTGGYISMVAPGAPVNGLVNVFNLGTEWAATNAVVTTNTTGAFDVFVAQANPQVIIDVMGYFARPKNYGGSHVITGANATDSGGFGNSATGDYSTITGGYGNIASGLQSAVGGGANNTASGSLSTVAGGYQNTAGGSVSFGSSTVAGGYQNTASGDWSTVAGGYRNTASGFLSFAAGSAANADQGQCFVFANWFNYPFGQTVSCQGHTNIARFAVDHGLFVDYFSPNVSGSGTRWVHMGDVISGQTIATWTGASLTDGGIWMNASDVASKADFLPVDRKEILSRVAQLPIHTWRYKAEDPEIRHLGPVAQDFRAAFGLGTDDKHIGTLDAEGVALAAIQALHDELQERDREIVRLKANSRLMERRLQALEAKLNRR